MPFNSVASEGIYNEFQNTESIKWEEEKHLHTFKNTSNTNLGNLITKGDTAQPTIKSLPK